MMSDKSKLKDIWIALGKPNHVNYDHRDAVEEIYRMRMREEFERGREDFVREMHREEAVRLMKIIKWGVFPLHVVKGDERQDFDDDFFHNLPINKY